MLPHKNMIDWAKLVSQNRAKAVGVPWTQEELKALYELKIPADYVREGILTLEEYNVATPIVPKTLEEVREEAKEEGIEVTPDAPKAEVEKLVKKAKDKKVISKKK